MSFIPISKNPKDKIISIISKDTTNTTLWKIFLIMCRNVEKIGEENLQKFNDVMERNINYAITNDCLCDKRLKKEINKLISKFADVDFTFILSMYNNTSDHSAYKFANTYWWNRQYQLEYVSEISSDEWEKIFTHLLSFHPEDQVNKIMDALFVEKK